MHAIFEPKITIYGSVFKVPMSLPGSLLLLRRSAPPPVNPLTAQDRLSGSEPEVRLLASVRTRSLFPEQHLSVQQLLEHQPFLLAPREGDGVVLV